MSTGSTFDPQQALSKHVLNNFYVGGEWTKPLSDRKLDLISPLTEECFVRVPEASEADVDRAVRAARQAFDHGPWPRMTVQERAKYVTAIGEELKKRLPLLINVWTAQVGAPQSFAGFVINYGPQLFEFYGQLGAKADFTETRDVIGGKAQIIREPVGVVAIITPWNAPLPLISYGVAAGLLAGCTIISKPAPETPLDALILAECAEAACLPPGVFNAIPAGREVGDYLINRPEIDKSQLHRQRRRRQAHRRSLRQAAGALHAGTRRQIAGGDHGRCRPFGSARRHRAVLDADVRPDLFFFDPRAGFQKAPRRSGRRL